MNLYTYPHNPLQIIDPLGLNPAAGALAGGAVGGPVGAVIGGLIGLAVTWALFSLAKSGSGSGTEDSNSKLDEFKDTEYKRAKVFVIKNQKKGTVIAHHYLRLLIMLNCVQAYMKVGIINGSPVDMI